MNIQEMKEKKKEKGYTNEQIAEPCRRFLEVRQLHLVMIH